MLGKRSRQTRPLARQLGHEIGEALLVHFSADHAERPGKRSVGVIARAGENVVARLGHQLGGPALVEHPEMRRQPRLERESAQKRLAEGVNGVDLEPARRIQHAGEESTRLGEAIGVRPGAAQRLQLRREPVVVLDRPLAQAVGKPDRHLLGGGLGEGETQEPLRRRAGKQQIEHAIDQHLGLAGTGRSRDPDR